MTFFAGRREGNKQSPGEEKETFLGVPRKAIGFYLVSKGESSARILTLEGGKRDLKKGKGGRPSGNPGEESGKASAFSDRPRERGETYDAFFVRYRRERSTGTRRKVVIVA